MLYLESFTHRVQLAEIVSRWIVNRPEDGDVAKIKRIVNFNSYIARIWVGHLVRDLLRSHTHGLLQSERIESKGDLKDAVAEHPNYRNDRIDQILAHYGRFPEDYYRQTPIDGSMYFVTRDGHHLFCGSSRIKRFRRIAEKGSRRIVQFMFDRIVASADDLATQRAMQLGIDRQEMISTKNLMVEEFAHAERRLIKSIKQGTILDQFPILAIPDAVGMKLIIEDEEYDRFVAMLEANKNIKLLEAERHEGRYRAVNLRVGYQLPKKLLLDHPPSGPYLEVLKFRGFDADRLAGDYREFVNSSEDHVIAEIIVSNFSDFMESEFGQSMHEERIVEQRSNQEYRSHLATNVRYLMHYMLSMCRAPGPGELTDVPIKLWVKHMPDTLEQHLALLYLGRDIYFDHIEEPAF